MLLSMANHSRRTRVRRFTPRMPEAYALCHFAWLCNQHQAIRFKTQFTLLADISTPRAWSLPKGSLIGWSQHGSALNEGMCHANVTISHLTNLSGWWSLRDVADKRFPHYLSPWNGQKVKNASLTDTCERRQRGCIYPGITNKSLEMCPFLIQIVRLH